MDLKTEYKFAFSLKINRNYSTANFQSGNSIKIFHRKETKRIHKEFNVNECIYILM